MASTGNLSTPEGENTSPLFNLMNNGGGAPNTSRPPPPTKEMQELMKNYTHEQIMEMYKQVMSGNVPENL